MSLAHKRTLRREGIARGETKPSELLEHVRTLVEVGRGAEPESWPGEVLVACDRRVAGATAPPCGLFLLRVEYPKT